MRLFFSSIFFLISIVSFGQTKSLQAFHTNEFIKVDGELTENVWLQTPYVSNFTAYEPKENIPSSQTTKVRIVYDASGIYIAAIMLDTHPDSIFRTLSRRDEDNVNADRFYVEFDTYHDKQNAYLFGVTAAGVQLDEKVRTENFDAIWESAVKITDSGWIAEIKIPYAAIRYPQNTNQSWGLQIKRHIRRNRETSSWVYIPNNVSYAITQFGTLYGLKDLPSPLRLFLIPYLGTTLNHYPYNSYSKKSNFTRSYNAGLDLKYGINESFTLDATLAPEFGQVQSDNNILNLTPFEQEFEERRPFFLEGTELFNVGRLFYARRIGGTVNVNKIFQDTNKSIKSISLNVQLLNATKISGRTKKGLGIGFINAITAENIAQYTLRTDSSQKVYSEVLNPLSNYNVIALNQTLKNNSFVSLMNTNVTRAGEKNNANVTASNFQLGNKNGNYALRGLGSISNKNVLGTITTGFRYDASIAKIQGNTQFEVGSSFIDTKYNPNDLGILFINNISNYFASLNFMNFKNEGIFIRRTHRFKTNLSTIYNTQEFQRLNLSYNNFFIFKNFFAAFGNIELVPLTFKDYYEPRVAGRVFRTPGFWGTGIGLSTDYRKPFAIDAKINYYRNFELVFGKGTFLTYSVSPLIRLNDHLFIKHDFQYTLDATRGYAAHFGDSLIYFGIRDVTTYTNTFSGQYVFNPRHSITLRVRHYWSTVKIDSYALLNSMGNLIKDTTNYLVDNNRSANFFNVDFVYLWRFAPGSDLLFVWKNSISTFASGSKASNTELNRTYLSDFSNTLSANQMNTFTVKVLFYLDYNYFKKRRI